jgi:YgiT-type zinc finger domain-containing protein
MECVICKNGTTKAGKETLSFERDGHLVVVRDIPGKICENCGHFYIDADAAVTLQKQAKKAIEDGAEVEILKYAS